MDANERQSTAVALLAWALLLAVVAAAPHATEMFARLRVNAGYLQLNRAFTTGEAFRFKDALATFERVEADSPAGQRAWRGRGLIHWSQSRFYEAIVAWERVPSVQSEFWSWASQAERADEIERARDWYWIAAQMEPENGDNWYQFARQSSRFENVDATDAYLRALAAPERSEFGRSNILTRLGELEKRQEPPDWAAVLERFDAAIALDEYVDEADVILSRLGRAEALERLGQLQAALDGYQWLARYSPGHYWANVHSGRLVWFLHQDAAAAEEYLQKAIAINDKQKWPYLYLGLAYAESGRSDEAIPLLERALALDPGDVTARDKLQELTAGDGS